MQRKLTSLQFEQLRYFSSKLRESLGHAFTSRSKTLNERGQSLVELALTLVILITIVAGIVDGTRALFTYMALRDAAQEGALYGQIDPENTTEILRRIERSSDFAENMWGSLTVNISYTDPSNNPKVNNICLGDGILVQVQYQNYPITMPFIGIFTGNSFDITANIADTVLQPRCP